VDSILITYEDFAVETIAGTGSSGVRTMAMTRTIAIIDLSKELDFRHKHNGPKS